MHGSSNIFFSVQAHFCCLATCVFVCADVSVGVGAFVCVCKIQLQDPSQSIASVERPAGAKHILQPDKHPRTTKTEAAEATG